MQGPIDVEVLDELYRRYHSRFVSAYEWARGGKRISDLVVERNSLPAISGHVRGEHGSYVVFIGPEGCWCRCRDFLQTRSPCKHILYVLLYCLRRGKITKEEAMELLEAEPS